MGFRGLGFKFGIESNAYVSRFSLSKASSVLRPVSLPLLCFASGLATKTIYGFGSARVHSTGP